jgi:mediator of RNA polymerase II transcription subunit 21
VNEINALFYNYTGILQRDARPAGTSGDQLGNEIPEGGPVDEGGIKEMAASVVASSRRVDELASALPEVELDEAAQLKRIAALQEENDRLERELKEELEKAGKTLARATAAFEAATNHVFVKADAQEAKAAAAEEMGVEP